jgi:SAM-dependent methyltransferase
LQDWLIMQAEQFAAHARVEQDHWWFVARRRVLLALLGRVAPAGGAVVDLGCGTGGNAAAFAAAGYQVVGLDPSAEAIAHARARFPEVRFELDDDPARIAPHLAGGGVAVLTDVLEHVADDHDLLRRTMAAVPLGGHLLLTVPADPGMWSGHDEVFGHHRRYTEATFRALWQGAAVRERLLSAYNARLYPAIATWRRLRRDRSEGAGDLSVPVGPLNALLGAIFAGERRALVAAVDRGTPPWRRGVSLVAILERT